MTPVVTRLHTSKSSCQASRVHISASIRRVPTSSLRKSSTITETQASSVGVQSIAPARSAHHSQGRMPVAVARSALAEARAAAGTAHDLLVVGPGVLGSYLGHIWSASYPGASVLGLTNTTTNHGRLSGLGLEPHTKETVPSRKFPNVVFAAPPSGSVDYAAEVQGALARWDGTGSFVFTSSMSVCSTTDGSTVYENCPLVAVGAGPGTDRLLGAEKATLEGGGNVLRLVGLYHAKRGGHTAFTRMQQVPRFGGSGVNLLHYEDAAMLTGEILKGGAAGPFRSRVFLGCDNNPVTYQEMMTSYEGSSSFPGAPACEFTEKTGAGPAKLANNSATCKELSWTPKYKSFVQFMEMGGEDVYSKSPLFQ